jgi:hypothetical protein
MNPFPHSGLEEAGEVVERLIREFPNGRLVIELIGPRAPNSMRRERMSRLVAEEVADGGHVSRSQVESPPSEPLASQPDAQPSTDEGSDGE